MVYIGFSFKNWMYWEQIQGFKIIIAKINDKKPLPDEKKITRFFARWGGAGKGHGCTHVHPIIFAKQLKLVGIYIHL